MSKNKVEFGLSGVHVSFLGETGWEKPLAIPGAVTFSPSPESEDYTFPADDGVYYADQTDSGYKGDLSMALLPDWFLGRALGYKKSGNIIVEIVGSKKTPFCLLFEGKGDSKKVRRMYINCTGGKPTQEFKTIDGTPEVAVQTIPITVMGQNDTVGNRQITHKVHEGDTEYATFFSDAPQLAATLEDITAPETP